MWQIITTKEQNKFLIENNCYFEFMENLRNNLLENCSEDWICGETSDFIAGDFIWKSTPQGQDYWGKIHNKYLSSINK